MIVLQGVTKAVSALGRKRHVLSSVNLTIPSDRRIALLGSSAEDKKILINLLAGTALPNAGHIVRNARVSFPVGHQGGFTADLSVRLNVAHVARLYGADVAGTVDFVHHVSGLGNAFDKAMRQLPKSLKKTDVYQIVAYALPVDLYLLYGEPIRKGRGYNRAIYELFEARARMAGMIIPIRHPRFAREYCDMSMVLERGQLVLFDSVDEGLAAVAKLKLSRRVREIKRD